MLVLSYSKSFCEPDIEKVDDIFENSISDSDFFIQYFMKVSEFCRKRRFSLGTIDTRLIGSIEGDIWCGIHIIFDPEAYSPRKYPE